MQREAIVDDYNELTSALCFADAFAALKVWDVKDPDDVCGICQNNFDGVCGSCKTPRGGDECPLRECI